METKGGGGAAGKGKVMGNVLLLIIVCVAVYLWRKKKKADSASAAQAFSGREAYAEPAPARDVKSGGLEQFPVRGAEYCQAAIEKHMEENPDWCKDYATLKREKKQWKLIYRYYPTDAEAELVPEPSNPHDKNAVMVCVGGDKVGYITAEECVNVLKLIRAGKIDRARVALKGGPVKRVFEDGKDAQDAEKFSVYLSIRIK